MVRNKEEVYDYIKSMIGMAVDDNTCFFDGVGIDGLDAEQMMIQIAQKYHVDLHDYDPYKYHLDEVEIANFLLHFWRMVRGKTPKHSSFTAQHLYNVIQAEVSGLLHQQRRMIIYKLFQMFQRALGTLNNRHFANVARGGYG